VRNLWRGRRSLIKFRVAFESGKVEMEFKTTKIKPNTGCRRRTQKELSICHRGNTTGIVDCEGVGGATVEDNKCQTDL
jgi:hypothetical protein